MKLHSHSYLVFEYDWHRQSDHNWAGSVVESEGCDTAVLGQSPYAPQSTASAGYELAVQPIELWLAHQQFSA